MSLLLYCVAFLAVGVVGSVAGLAWIFSKEKNFTINGQTRSTKAAGVSMLAIGLIGLIGGYLMSTDVEPALWPVAASMVAPLVALVLTGRAVTPRGVDRLVRNITSHLEVGHDATEIQVRGRTAARKVLRAALSVPRTPADASATDYRSPNDGGAEAYAKRVGRAAERAKRRAVAWPSLGAASGTIPFAVLAHYGVGDLRLEPLGFQVLGVGAALGAASFVLLAIAMRQARHAAAAVTEVTENAAHARPDAVRTRKAG